MLLRVKTVDGEVNYFENPVYLNPSKVPFQLNIPDAHEDFLIKVISTKNVVAIYDDVEDIRDMEAVRRDAIATMKWVEARDNAPVKEKIEAVIESPSTERKKRGKKSFIPKQPKQK